MNKDNRLKELIIPILISVIGLVGGLSGVYLGASLDSNSKKEASQLAYKQEIIQQRIKIIDRTATIYGKAPGISGIWKIYLNQPESSNEQIETSKILAEYNAEFNAVINLSNIYFGPKTRKAIKMMADKKSPWWNKDSDLVSKYLGAMASELKYGLE
ncbi:hypothetical protein [uncultured Sulfuricurvum sp.]|uniref:hypothetical protein n=1 Tax=uncultured Sulfuricurvum sp. TaxID=430693 RepID=UPI00261EA9AF|nr:hypothetical protein [uncultured Sulfuricurvum sp.]